MIDLNAVWYLLVGVLIVGYALLDGFDLGVGVLSLFSRNEAERRIHLGAIGPFWDGNEVWLLTAGGALFAAFPPVYASVFSGFYLAFMLLLVALIFRAISIEFYGKVESPAWRTLWGWAFGIGSLAPSILFGVAFGNILRGVPIDENGEFVGTFLGLLNPFAILLGLLSLTMFIMHGAAFMTVKTTGDLRNRMHRWAIAAWVLLAMLYIPATLFTALASPFLFEGLSGSRLFYINLAVLTIGIVSIPASLQSGRYRRAFVGTAATIAAMIAMAGISLFPRLVPSTIDLAYSLTIYNASSTPRTLRTMLVIALIGMPLVLIYTAWVYWVFRGKAETHEDGY